MTAGYPRTLFDAADVQNGRAAQQAHAPDAALRPQDRGDFESRFQLDSFPDLSGRRG